MQKISEDKPDRRRNPSAAHVKAAAKWRPWLSVLSLAALLVVASSACTATTATPTRPVQAAVATLAQGATEVAASTLAPAATEAAVSTLASGETEGAAPAVTPTLGIIRSLARRTPEPTMAPGPLERAIFDLTSAAGVEDTSVLGLTAGDWINLAISVLLVLLTVACTGPLLRRALPRVLKTTSTDLDDRLGEAVLPQLWKFLVVVVTEFATRRLDFLSDQVQTLLGDVFFLMYVVILGRALWRLLVAALDWYGEEIAAKHRDQTRQDNTVVILTMIRRVGKIVIVWVCISLILERLGVQITAVMTSLGLIGLAFSLAAQDTLSDFISGFLIMFDRPFRIGDRIEIEKINTWGDVVDIGARTTRIRTRDNRLVIVPNSNIGKNQIVNYSYPDPHYRVQIEIGIGYDADIEETRHIIEDAVGQVDGVLQEEPVEALFLEFGPSAMVFRVRWWIHSYADTRRMFDRVNEAMYKALSAAGVPMPFTTYDVNVKLDTRDAERVAGLSGGRSSEASRAATAGGDLEQSP